MNLIVIVVNELNSIVINELNLASEFNHMVVELNAVINELDLGVDKLNLTSAKCSGLSTRYT